MTRTTTRADGGRAGRIRTSTTGRRPIRTWILPALALLATLGSAPLAAQTAVDEAGITRAALDYLEGFYEGSDEKLRRSIHPEVNKFGFSRGPGGSYRTIPMSYDAMFAFADGVRNGRNAPPAGAPKEVEILDAADQIAVVKVTAWWGFDYLQMARYDGRWMIVQVLWQSPPPA